MWNIHARDLAISSALAMALSLSFGGCGRSSENSTSSNPSSNDAAQQAGRDIDNAGRTVADNMETNITTQPRASNLPGMPSVNGTKTTGMSTADAAAQRLIDSARNNLRENDIAKAKTLLSELKDKGMYDSLSAAQRSDVDQLEQDLNAVPTTQPTAENR